MTQNPRPSKFVPSRVLDTVYRRLGSQALSERLQAVRALAVVRGARYVDDAGRVRMIDIAATPWILTSAQLYYFHGVMRHLVGALQRLPTLYARVPSVRQILHFDTQRESWLNLAAAPAAAPLAVIGRLDSTATYDHARWPTSFRMLEPNAVGVGGVHYAPTACSIIMDVFGDLLTRAFGGHALTPTPDPRRLLVDELTAVARRLGRPLRGIALIENQEFTTGTDEFQELARYLSDHGLQAVVADPRELRHTRGHLRARQIPVDLLYRDSELDEFIQMESSGRRLTALRTAIREGRLVSGLSWEFDQKSAWEIFTDAQYARYFPLSAQQLFRDHLLWTRLVRAARVSDPSGRLVDLPDFIRRHRARLVLKPNTLFGGAGVVLGLLASQRVWEQTLDRALRGRLRYVVQSLAQIPTQTLPFPVGSHGIRWQRRCVVSGFFFNSSAIGLVGRFSGQPVVNVSQGGGLVSALWLHP